MTSPKKDPSRPGAAAPVPHRIERTRNRHSRAVLRDDTIVIRLARGLTTREEQIHIDSLLRRMQRHVLREQKRLLIDPFRPLLIGNSAHTITLANGTQYHFVLIPGRRTRATRTPGEQEGWHLSIGPGTRRRSLHRFLWKLLAHAELQRITHEVHRINTLNFRERITRVRLAYASSQWGSCSSRGAIHLNPVLLFLPQHLLDYVIVHELAHCHIHNHSRRFWNHVATACPQYEAARTELRNVRICRL